MAWRRTSVVALALGALAACSSTPSIEVLREDLVRKRVPGGLIDTVPRVCQEQHGYCGPAALAAVATSCGIAASTEQIGSQTYLAAVAGSFTFDLERAARALGLVTRARYDCSLDSVLRWIDAGVPVIVLRTVGNWPLRTHHYQIVVGYDTSRQLIVLKDARDDFAILPYDEFTADWPGQYALALLRESDIELATKAAQYAASGDLLAAARDYRRQLQRFPADLESAYNLALVEQRLGQRDAAKAHYEGILELYPSDGPSANNLADLLRSEHSQLDRAEALVRHAIEGDPRNGYYYRETLAEILSAVGRSSDALEQVRLALADPRNADPDLRRRLQDALAALSACTES